MTIHYFNNKNDIKKVIDSQLMELENSTVEVKVTGIAYDDKAIALTIESPIEIHNEHPHVTLYFSEGMNPFYSNDMLKNPDVIIPLDMKLNGTLVRHITIG